MRFLRVFFAGVLVSALRQIFFAKVVADITANHVQRVLTQVGGVGTHIGDVPCLIESLSHHHGLFHAEAQTGAGRLLQGGGDERRARLAAGRLVFPLQYAVAGFFQQRYRRHGLITADRTERLIVFMGHLQRQRVAAWRGGAGINFPVLFRDERFDFTLTLHHQADRDGLHAPGRKTTGNFFPQQRRNHITHHAVHKATRLLGVNPIDIQLARLFESLTNGVFGDLIEHHAAVTLFIAADHFPQVPGNGFPFAVKVGCEIDVVSFFRQLFEF